MNRNDASILSVTVSHGVMHVYLVPLPALIPLLGDISYRDTVGVTYGVNFTVKYGIGAILPSMAGWIAVNYGWDFVFYFFAVLSALAFFLTLFLKDKRMEAV